VLRALQERHADSFVAFARSQSAEIHAQLLALPWSAEQQARFEAMSARSFDAQRAIEAADSLPFEMYRQEYVSARRLGRAQAEPLALA
jgi:glutamate--cysteine ligase